MEKLHICAIRILVPTIKNEIKKNGVVHWLQTKSVNIIWLYVVNNQILIHFSFQKLIEDEHYHERSKYMKEYGIYLRMLKINL